MKHKFSSMLSAPEGHGKASAIASCECGSSLDFSLVRGTTNGKEQDSRGAFKVGVAYNSILDDREDEEEKSDCDSGVSFFTAKDSAIDPVPGFHDNTEPSSFLCDNDPCETSLNMGQKSKKRRVIKKKSAQENLLRVDVLPDSFQTVFEFEFFNRMQTEAFPAIYETDENCVVSSPTGSGKTVLFELAIMRLIKGRNGATDNIKVLYIAPTKSLCCEKFKSWSSRFLGLSVGMLTSDTSFLETEKVKKCNIIITTPEKWDLLTRKWKDYSRLFELIKLILVDEVHSLRERRGATLEVVLTRMNLFCDKIRIIAVSATIPNVNDVAQWLGSKSPDRPAKVLAFDDTYRQVTLEKYVYGCSFKNKNDFQHDSLYNLKLEEILLRHSKKRAVLIFCPTRASSVSTAKYVAQRCLSSLSDRKKNHNRRFDDQNLASLVQQGVAFHHAGLSLTDREFVEQGFLSGEVIVLCSTSTLAVGVNLPAYLVIIKGTKMWNASVTQEYSNLDILQMIGRAGRPQFGKTGCAVILTESKMQDSYEKLLLGTDELESALHLELIEHLAAEISLATVYSAQSAVTWLRNTYFYVRFRKNPSACHEVNKMVKDRLDQDSQIVRFVQNLLNVLLEHRIIEHQGDQFVSTPYGRAMARHYVLFDSMKRFLKAENRRSPEDILRLLANAKEFADIRIRQKEKRLYKEINSSPLLRFPYLTEGKQSRTIDAPDQKVSLLIQYELGGLEFPSYNGAFALHQTMVQDKLLVFRHCFRLLKCMVDIFVEKGDGTSLRNALFILRSVCGNCWEDSVMVLRQLKSIGLVSVRKLVQRGVRSLQDVSELSDQQIESYLSLKMGNGSKIKRDVKCLPRLQMECTLQHYDTQKAQILATFRVQISAIFTSPMWHGQSLSIDVEVLKTSGKLLDFRRIALAHLASLRTFTVTAVIESEKDDVEFSINCLEVAGLGEKTKFFAADLFSKVSRPSDKAVEAQGTTSFTQQSKVAEASSPSSDDSILDYLSTQPEDARGKRINDKTDKSVLNNRRVRSNGNFECYHSCKDKKGCRHLCCKEGIPGSCLRDKIIPINSKSNSFQTTDTKETFRSSKVKALRPEKPILMEPKQSEVVSVLSNLIAGSLPRETSFGATITPNYPTNELRPVFRQTDCESRPSTASSSSISMEATRSEKPEQIDLEFLGSDIELR